MIKMIIIVTIIVYICIYKKYIYIYICNQREVSGGEAGSLQAALGAKIPD